MDDLVRCECHASVGPRGPRERAVRRNLILCTLVHELKFDSLTLAGPGQVSLIGGSCIWLALDGRMSARLAKQGQIFTFVKAQMEAEPLAMEADAWASRCIAARTFALATRIFRLRDST